MIFFSVVIPLYNKEKYIKRTIKSVLNQTFKNFEILIINDGSTDNSAQRVKEFNDSRIKLITKINGGEGSARNKGIRESSGNYIAFLDADDAWEASYLETIVTLINKYKEGLAFSTALKTRERDNKFYNAKYFINHLPWEGYVMNYFEHISNDSYPFSSSSTCVKKSIFDEVGFFNEKLKIGADIDMWIRLFLKGKMVFTSKICCVYYKDAQNRSIDLHNLIDKQLDFFNHLDRYKKLLHDESHVKYFNNYVKLKRLQLTHSLIAQSRKKEAWNLMYSHILSYKIRNQLSLLVKYLCSRNK